MHRNQELTHSDLQKIDKNRLNGLTLAASFLTTKRPSRVENCKIFPLRGPKAGGSAPLHPPIGHPFPNVRTRHLPGPVADQRVEREFTTEKCMCSLRFEKAGPPRGHEN